MTKITTAGGSFEHDAFIYHSMEITIRHILQDNFQTESTWSIACLDSPCWEHTPFDEQLFSLHFTTSQDSPVHWLSQTHRPITHCPWPLQCLGTQSGSCAHTIVVTGLGQLNLPLEITKREGWFKKKVLNEQERRKKSWQNHYTWWWKRQEVQITVKAPLATSLVSNQLYLWPPLWNPVWTVTNEKLQ